MAYSCRQLSNRRPSIRLYQRPTEYLGIAAEAHLDAAGTASINLRSAVSRAAWPARPVVLAAAQLPLVNKYQPACASRTTRSRS